MLLSGFSPARPGARTGLFSLKGPLRERSIEMKHVHAKQLVKKIGILCLLASAFVIGLAPQIHGAWAFDQPTISANPNPALIGRTVTLSCTKPNDYGWNEDATYYCYEYRSTYYVRENGGGWQLLSGNTYLVTEKLFSLQFKVVVSEYKIIIDYEYYSETFLSSLDAYTEVMILWLEVFADNFEDDEDGNTPGGWTIHQDPDGVYDDMRVVVNGTAGSYLRVSDDSEAYSVFGYGSCDADIDKARLEFDLQVSEATSAIDTTKRWEVTLQTAEGIAVCAVQFTYKPWTDNFTISIGDTSVETQYVENSWYHLRLWFEGTTLNLVVNGTPMLSGVLYDGGTIRRVCIQTTVATEGLVCYFDNFFLRRDWMSPPVIVPIITDYDGNVAIRWSTVNEALSYRIYRTANPVTDVTALNPIGISTTTYFVDAGRDTGTYWYTVVALSNYGNSLPSDSKIAHVSRNNRSVALWEDFDTGKDSETPVGWTVHQNPVAGNYFNVDTKSMDTPILCVVDDQDKEYVRGNLTFPAGVLMGRLEFDLRIQALNPQFYETKCNFRLQTKDGLPASNPLLFSYKHEMRGREYFNITSGNYETDPTSSFFDVNTWHHIRMDFNSTYLNLTVDSAPKLVNIANNGGRIQQLCIETDISGSGLKYSFDNILLITNNPIPYALHQEDFVDYKDSFSDPERRLSWMLFDDAGIDGQYEIRLKDGSLIQRDRFTSNQQVVGITVPREPNWYTYTLSIDDGNTSLFIADTVTVYVGDDDYEGPIIIYGGYTFYFWLFTWYTNAYFTISDKSGLGAMVVRWSTGAETSLSYDSANTRWYATLWWANARPTYISVYDADNDRPNDAKCTERSL